MHRGSKVPFQTLRAAQDFRRSPPTPHSSQSNFVAPVRTVRNAIADPRGKDPGGAVAAGKGLLADRHVAAGRRLGLVGAVPQAVAVVIVGKANATANATGDLRLVVVYAAYPSVVIASIVSQHLIDVLEFVLDLVVVIDLDP